MELLKPINQVGYKEVAHFVAAVVEDEGAPLLVLADARIGMLIKMGAIKEGQAVGIFGEVAWHPVEDHADAFGVATVYKGAEFIRLVGAYQPVTW